jgi:TolA-binding protein
MGREDDAAARFQRLLDEHPGSRYEGHALRHLGSIAMRRGDSADAESYLARAGTHFGDDGSLDIERVRALLELGRSEEALEVLGSRSRNEPRFGLGWSVENGGDPEAAIEHYRLVTDEHRGGTAARAQFQIGECLFALGRHDEAVRELLRVDILYAEPEWSAAAVYEAGRCFEAMGKVGEARAQYRDVAERFGESDWARAAGERLAALRRGRVPGRGGDG